MVVLNPINIAELLIKITGGQSIQPLLHFSNLSHQFPSLTKKPKNTETDPRIHILYIHTAQRHHEHCFSSLHPLSYGLLGQPICHFISTLHMLPIQIPIDLWMPDVHGYYIWLALYAVPYVNLPCLPILPRAVFFKQRFNPAYLPPSVSTKNLSRMQIHQPSLSMRLYLIMFNPHPNIINSN